MTNQNKAGKIICKCCDKAGEDIKKECLKRFNIKAELKRELLKLKPPKENTIVTADFTLGPKMKKQAEENRIDLWEKRIIEFFDGKQNETKTRNKQIRS